MTRAEKRQKNREYMRHWRIEHPEENKRRQAVWRLNNPGRMSELNRAWREKNRAYDYKRKHQWARLHPDVVRAERMARRKVALADRCERCGSQAEERHHSDYSRPLLVMHLCARCHVMLHRKIAV